MFNSSYVIFVGQRVAGYDDECIDDKCIAANTIGMNGTK